MKGDNTIYVNEADPDYSLLKTITPENAPDIEFIVFFTAP